MTSATQIAIVADDLTGALDAIAPFAEAGLRCVVATTPDYLQAGLALGAPVVAVSTNSRDKSAADAAGCAHGVALHLGALNPPPLLFKKVDSRLKGQIAAELVALAGVLQVTRVLLCPAIPGMGRIVRGGDLTGTGVALPLRVSTVLQGATGITATTPDAETDADLDALVAELPPRLLLAGARGLAAALARHWPQRRPVRLALPQPAALVIGSRDPITLAQVAHLRACLPGAYYRAAPNGIATGAVPPAPVAVLQAVPGSADAAPAAVTADLALAFVRDFVPGRAGLVLTGGETAAAVLAQMGIGLLQVLGEVLPGMPLCQVLDFPGAPLIVTKSGGFGAADALCRLVMPDPASGGRL